MLAPLIRVRDGVMGIGVRPTDRPEDRLRKEALVLTALAISVLATIWTGTYLLLGRPVSAAVPFSSALRGEYLFEDRGAIDVKGLGEMRTFFLVGRRP